MRGLERREILPANAQGCRFGAGPFADAAAARPGGEHDDDTFAGGIVHAVRLGTAQRTGARRRDYEAAGAAVHSGPDEVSGRSLVDVLANCSNSAVA